MNTDLVPGHHLSQAAGRCSVVEYPATILVIQLPIGQLLAIPFLRIFRWYSGNKPKTGFFAAIGKGCLWVIELSEILHPNTSAFPCIKRVFLSALTPKLIDDEESNLMA